jgi:hypothetical protein
VLYLLTDNCFDYDLAVFRTAVQKRLGLTVVSSQCGDWVARTVVDLAVASQADHLVLTSPYSFFARFIAEERYMNGLPRESTIEMPLL